MSHDRELGVALWEQFLDYNERRLKELKLMKQYPDIDYKEISDIWQKMYKERGKHYANATMCAVVFSSIILGSASTQETIDTVKAVNPFSLFEEEEVMDALEIVRFFDKYDDISIMEAADFYFEQKEEAQNDDHK